MLDDNLMFKFQDGQHLNLECSDQTQGKYGTSTLALRYNTATKTYSRWSRFDLAHFSRATDSQQNREAHDVQSRVRQGAGAMSGRPASAAYTYIARPSILTTAPATSSSVHQHVQRGTPLVGPAQRRTAGRWQDRHAGRYKTFHGAVKNKTLITLDYNQNWRYRKQTTFDQIFTRSR